MAPWEALAAYALVLVAAALLGWLPFRFLEYISIVEDLDVPAAESDRRVGSRVTCPGCGAVTREPARRSLSAAGTSRSSTMEMYSRNRNGSQPSSAAATRMSAYAASASQGAMRPVRRQRE